MPFTESFLNKVLRSQVGQSGSSYVIQRFWESRLFRGAWWKGQPVGESVIADVTKPRKVLTGFPHRLHIFAFQRNDIMNLIVVSAVEMFYSI